MRYHKPRRVDDPAYRSSNLMHPQTPKEDARATSFLATFTLAETTFLVR